MQIENKDLIYHYTDEKGLKGIFDSQCLWAVHFECLNDKSEIRDIQEHIKIFRNQPTSIKRNKERKYFCNFLNGSINDFYLSTLRKADIYVSCFSESPECKDLWNNEAKNGRKEYAICFSKRAINDLITREEMYNIGAEAIHQVCYEKQTKQKILKKFEEHFNAFFSFKNLDKENVKYNKDEVIKRLMCLPALFKKPKKWQHQKEWRIIIRVPTKNINVENPINRIDKVIKNISPSKNYIELFNAERNEDFNGLSMAVKGILVGPKGRLEIAKKILEKHKISVPVEKNSGITYL